jgi:excisionase family DNA binding protein
MPSTTEPTSTGLRTRAESALYLRTSQRRLDELIRSGALAAVRDGRSVKIPAAELERYINDLPAYEPAS